MQDEGSLTGKEAATVRVLLQRNAVDAQSALNPYAIQKWSYPKVSRAWARKACDNLGAVGILDAVEKRSSTRTEASPHFFLHRNFRAFENLTKRYFATLLKDDPSGWASTGHYYLDSDYVQGQLTMDFVRDILARKKIKMIGHYSPKDWENNRQQENDEKSERSSLHPTTVLFPISTIERPYQRITPEFLHSVPKDYIEQNGFREFVRNHYEICEGRNLILPILGLIQISPTALSYFLSDWQPFVTDTFSWSSEDQGIGFF